MWSPDDEPNEILVALADRDADGAVVVRSYDAYGAQKLVAALNELIDAAHPGG